MASQKDIELILKARVDQGDSLSQAQSMAKSMADALENAFNGVGERIADKILREMQGKFAGMDLFSNYESPNKPKRESSITGMMAGGDGQVSQLIAPPVAPTFGANLGSNVLSSLNKSAAGGLGFKHYKIHDANSIMSGSEQRQSQYHDPYKHGLMSTLQSRLPQDSAANMGLNPTASHLGDMAYANKKEAIKADNVINNLRHYQSLKDMGSNADINNFASAKDIQGAQDTVNKLTQGAADKLMSLNDSIAQLKIAILDNTEASKSERQDMKAEGYDPDSEEQVGKYRKKKQRSEQEDYDNLDEYSDELKNRKQQLDKYKKPSEPTGMQKLAGWFNENQGMVRGTTAALGAVAFGSQVLSERHSVERQAQGGKARLQEYGMRDINNGDYGSMMATEMLGGEDLMRQEATSNVNHRLRRDRAQIAATALGGIAAGSAIGSTVIGAPVGALVAGGAMIGAAYQGYEYHKNVKNKAGLIEEQMRQASGQTKEQYQLMADAINTNVQASPMAYNMAQSAGSDAMTGHLMGNDQNVMDASLAGLHAGDVRNIRANYTSNTFGVRYNSSTGRDESIYENDKGYQQSERNLFKLQGAGWNEAGNISAAYARGGASSGIDAAVSGYSAMRGSGIEQMQAQQIMNMSSNIASRSGSAAQGTQFTERIAAGALRLGRQDPNTIDLLGRAQQKMIDSRGSSGGLEAEARRQTVVKFRDDWKKDLGIEFTDEDADAMSLFDINGEGLKQMVARGKGDKDQTVRWKGEDVKIGEMHDMDYWNARAKDSLDYQDNTNIRLEDELYGKNAENIRNTGVAQNLGEHFALANGGRTTEGLKLSDKQKEEANRKYVEEREDGSGDGGKFTKDQFKLEAAKLIAGATKFGEMLPAYNANIDKMIAKMQTIADMTIKGLVSGQPQGGAPSPAPTGSPIDSSEQ